MKRVWMASILLLLSDILFAQTPTTTPVAIKAGRLIDVVTGKVLQDDCGKII